MSKNKEHFPDRWIVTKAGELVELGCDLEPIWGFTIKGMEKKEGNSIVTPLHSKYRVWENIDKFLQK